MNDFIDTTTIWTALDHIIFWINAFIAVTFVLPAILLMAYYLTVFFFQQLIQLIHKLSK